MSPFCEKTRCRGLSAENDNVRTSKSICAYDVGAGEYGRTLSVAPPSTRTLRPCARLFPEKSPEPAATINGYGILGLRYGGFTAVCPGYAYVSTEWIP